ncbi:MAG: diaminopimelate decarboxylase [Bacteroidales bacterium]|nr:diaminopimelate decarboxylase [Bacteroidales bacterium]
MKYIDRFKAFRTPCYYYDIELLEKTLDTIVKSAGKYPNFHVHYAVKANANPRILGLISSYGLGADCVSGNEVLRALQCGFPANGIVYAGVGKSDREIEAALRNDIFCFNCESLPEIEVINEIAGNMGKKAKIAIRVNPNVDAHTHAYITTGLEENKFGIYLTDLDKVIDQAMTFPNVEVIGLHFHIGSQITDLNVFKALAERVNEIQDGLEARGIVLPNVNLGGGLGIDYNSPYSEPVANFEGYFDTIARYLRPRPGQQVHFEPGRSVVAHCGDLIARVLYVKEGKKKFAILDAGMSDLIRPALYQAYHNIENITSESNETELYDVVGPICESSDCFGKDVELKKTKRGDMVILHSAGAYGEVMASEYNLRDLPSIYYSK